MSKNIVICCDGTGNEISENISNVLKLYRTLRKTGKTEPRQVVFYDPGVGTLSLPNPWIKFKQDAEAILGLVTGYGLDQHVLNAYQFLIDQYVDGDSIYLFGFSRGAHTVRVLAALIHKVGLPRPEQRNLGEAALAAYKQTKEDPKAKPETFDADGQPAVFNEDDRCAQFARIISTRWPTIAFMGVWDTVASVIVPRPDRFYTFSLLSFPFTQHNPSVRVFRQAIAIDERRRMFRLSAWEDPQTFMKNRFSATNNSEPQDIKQVWFAGVHADIGGGYPEKESGLSKFPLIWMIEEAVKYGLAVDPRTVNQLAWGVQRQGSPFSYVTPDCTGPLHQSLRGLWHLLEYVPKSVKQLEWKDRATFLGHYLPDGEPRPIPEGAMIHASVSERLARDSKYRPINLPKNYEIMPYSKSTAEAPAI